MKRIIKINGINKIEDIHVALFDVWKDGRAWKVKLPHGIETRKTKEHAVKLSELIFQTLNKGA